MTRPRLAVVGAVLAAGALVAVPTAAVGHTDLLYTWGYAAESSAFLTMSKADAALAPLAALPDSIEHVTGVEICDEVAFALDAGTETLHTWNHTTGDLLGSAPVTDGYESLSDLDALADCTILTVAWSDAESAWVVLSLDPETGAATNELELTDLTDPEAYYTGIATSPEGITTVFGVADGRPFASEVDIVTPVQELPTYMDGVWNAVGQGTTFLAGIDYDATGALWFIQGVDAEETLYLMSFAPGDDLYAAEPVERGVVPYGAPAAAFVDLAQVPLAAEHALPAPAPQLAATGAETPAGVVLAAGILVLAGAGALIVRRRAA